MTATTVKEEIYLDQAKKLSVSFAKDAAQGDKEGGTPKQQKDAIRQSGLLNLLIPQKYGGEGGK